MTLKTCTTLILLFSMSHIYVLGFNIKITSPPKASSFTSMCLFITKQDLEKYGVLLGYRFTVKQFGPGIRIEAFEPGTNDPVGYVSGFLRPIPSRMLHLETIVVKNRRQNLVYKRKSVVVGAGPGVSFILGSLILRWAHDK